MIYFTAQVSGTNTLYGIPPTEYEKFYRTTIRYFSAVTRSRIRSLSGRTYVSVDTWCIREEAVGRDLVAVRKVLDALTYHSESGRVLHDDMLISKAYRDTADKAMYGIHAGRICDWRLFIKCLRREEKFILYHAPHWVIDTVRS